MNPAATERAHALGAAVKAFEHILMACIENGIDTSALSATVTVTRLARYVETGEIVAA